MRKVAVHSLMVEPTGQSMEMVVIEMRDGIVTDYYPFTNEQAQTEWIGGTVILRKNEQGQLQAFKNNRLLC